MMNLINQGVQDKMKIKDYDDNEKDINKLNKDNKNVIIEKEEN